MISSPKRIRMVLKLRVLFFSLILFLLATPVFAQTVCFVPGFGSTYCPGQCVAYLTNWAANMPSYLVGCNHPGYTCQIEPGNVIPGPYTLQGYVVMLYAPDQRPVGPPPTSFPINSCNEFAAGTFPETNLPPISTQNSCFVPTHSSINMDTLSLQESIPLVGAPFDLHFLSNWALPTFEVSYQALGLGRWSPSIRHHYSSSKKIIYFGDGNFRTTEAITIPGGYYVTNTAGTEIYYFNSSGVHLQTKETLTNLIKYSFSYDTSGRITSISDRFGNVSSFNYSANQVLLTSPYGQITRLVLDSNGRLGSVTNPNNETYTITYDSIGYLASFTKPGGQKSIVTYDTNGFVVKDTGAGGDFVSLSRSYDTLTKSQTVTTETALGRQTVYQTTATSTQSQHKVIDPSGKQLTYSNQDQGMDNSQNSLGVIQSSNQNPDPRFGWLAPYSQTSNFSIVNSNINLSVVTNKSAQLSNVNDPLSLTSLLTTVTVQNDASRTFSSSYTAANKLVTNTSAVNRVTYQQLNDLGLLSSVQVGPLVPVLFSYDDRGRQRTTYTSQPKRPYIFVYI